MTLLSVLACTRMMTLTRADQAFSACLAGPASADDCRVGIRRLCLPVTQPEDEDNVDSGRYEAIPAQCNVAKCRRQSSQQARMAINERIQTTCAFPFFTFPCCFPSASP